MHSYLRSVWCTSIELKYCTGQICSYVLYLPHVYINAIWVNSCAIYIQCTLPTHSVDCLIVSYLLQSRHVFKMSTKSKYRYATDLNYAVLYIAVPYLWFRNLFSRASHVYSKIVNCPVTPMCIYLGVPTDRLHWPHPSFISVKCL